MKIGIYGGSFNPIHFGHIGLAEWVAKNTEVEEVWLLVTPNNPLKDAAILADENKRLKEVEKAIEGIEGVRVSDFEFQLPRPSYTANTLRALSEKYKEHRFSLIIGEDNVDILTKWREWEYIVKNYTIWVYPRRQKGAENSDICCKGKEELPSIMAIKERVTEADIVYLADGPYFDISSTEIRAKKGK